MEATPITDIWDDTGILPPIPAAGVPVSDEVLAVREGKLSPLAIKRSSKTLQKSEDSQKVYRTLEDNAIQIQRVFEAKARILGLISEKGTGKSYGVEKLCSQRRCHQFKRYILGSRRNRTKFSKTKRTIGHTQAISKIPVGTSKRNTR